jgi:putative oxidoreductase
MKRGTIIEIIAALFILLFVYTGVSKLMEHTNFTNVLKGSPLVGSFAGVVAWALPITELIVALLLIFPKTRLKGLYASAILMSMFTIYLAYMIAFTPKLPCSCGGVLKELTWKQHLVFNIFFTLLAIWGIMLSRRNNKHEMAEATAVRLKTKYSV